MTRLDGFTADLVPGEPAEEWGTDVGVEVVLGAPCHVFTKRPRHIGALLAEGRRHGDALYLVQGDRRLSFAAHESAVVATRRILERSGVGRGDPVMILGANSVELVTAFWATVHLGAIAVMGNAWWSGSEIAHAIDSVRPAVTVCDARRRARLPEEAQVISYEELEGLTLEPTGVNTDPVPVAEDDPAVVIFTSGTTGFAKGARLSHRGILATLQSLLVVTNRLPGGEQAVSRGSVSLLSLPLFHIGGLQQIITSLVTGGTLVFTEGRFDPAAVVDLIDREGVKVWSAVPTMVSRVLDQLETTGRSLPSLRTVGMGGAPVPEVLRERVRRVLPAARRGAGVTWGLTEAGGVVTTAAGDAIAARPGCVGKLLPTSEVRVASPDESGAGELLVRSPSVMLGYWGNDADSVIDDDRWLHTGDVGRVDHEGYVYVSGREKDIIIRGGENIACGRVEDEIALHPAVAEVAVVGLPDAELGEQVGAVVVPNDPDALNLSELERFLASRLAHFELPSQWWVHPGPLPQNATGKVLKSELRAQWAARIA